MTDVPVPATGSTNWSGPGSWVEEVETLTDIVRARDLGWNVITDPQWAGGAVMGTDATAAIQAATNAGGVVYFPPTMDADTNSFWGCAGITINGTQTANSVRWVGAGKDATRLRLTNSANTNMVTVGVGPLPQFADLWFDGNKTNNTAGNCIEFSANATGTFQGSGDFYRCKIVNAPVDGIKATQSRALGRIINCTLGQAGQDNVSLHGTDWKLADVNIEDAGRYNVYLPSASGFSATNGQWYRALGTAGVHVGFNTFYSKFTNIVIDSNRQTAMHFNQSSGGTAGSNQTVPNGHQVIGCTFFNNSGGTPAHANSGTYSDILLNGVWGIQVIGCNFTFQGSTNTLPKYHIEDTSPTGSAPSRHVLAVGNQFWDTAPPASSGRLSYGTGFTNVVDITRVDHAMQTTLDGFGDNLDTGESVIPRRNVNLASVSLSASGTMRLTYFRARESGTVTSVRLQGGSVAAATATLVRIGIYSEAANGDLTLVASTTSDTALFGTTFTEYTKALTTPWAGKVAGARYAVGVLVLATTTPTFYGVAGSASGGLPGAEMFRGPKLCANLASQTDLPSSITAGSLSNTSGGLIYAALV